MTIYRKVQIRNFIMHIRTKKQQKSTNKKVQSTYKDEKTTYKYI